MTAVAELVSEVGSLWIGGGCGYLGDNARGMVAYHWSLDALEILSRMNRELGAYR